MRRTQLRAVSRKKQAEMEARRQCMEVVRERDHSCRAAALVTDVLCSGPLDGHEPLPRSRGGDPTDADHVVLVCRRHHSWIHANPAESYELGLLERSVA